MEELLAANGFEIVRSYYSTVNDLAYVDAKGLRQHLSVAEVGGALGVEPEGLAHLVKLLSKYHH
ncbi:hypothetical protein TCELL_0194 [Thermogladius calderae 1633]|uniref:Uncharacterized protein n=1 Tax=Thermogladius calderae (strain DSM 22663 / VKM B-2946 / 1633) TaxID=1184251 RepID=I3TCY1_THEC1|nr:hypothetical protein [Thermogladius calderae]AFK50619.1 hypothetical protein TCELL_0194 [Thermogladius calderae 1633]